MRAFARSAFFLILVLGWSVHADKAPGHPPFAIHGDRVLGRDSKGDIRWSTRLDGNLGTVRPPDVLWDEKRVYISHKQGITALHVHDGAVLWHWEGPNHCLLLSGNLLLATDCSVAPRGGRWLLARDVSKGHEAFKVKLPSKDFDPMPI